MGSILSSSKNNNTCNDSRDRRQKSLTEYGNGSSTGMSVGAMDSFRFAELLHALQKIAKLQQEASSAGIDARQKSREAAFKRQEVWIGDAKFMGEIQKLSAKGTLAGFEKLQRLASYCQDARDGLGSLEQEGAEAERHWEGQLYILRKAEERLYDDFNREFLMASAHTKADSSDDSSQYGSVFGASREDNGRITSNGGQRIIPYRIAGSGASTSSVFLRPQIEELPSQNVNFENCDTPLPGLEGITAAIGSHASGSDYEFGEVNGSMDDLGEIDSPGPPQSLPKRFYSSLELYPGLVVDFKSKRDRINKWLEGNALESRLEATSLYNTVKNQLAAEDKAAPSNWSQLVIAYWELDGAANLRFGHEDCDFANRDQHMRGDDRDDISLRQFGHAKDVYRHGARRLSGNSISSEAAANMRRRDAGREPDNFEPITGPRSMGSGSIVPPSPPQSHPNSETEEWEKRRDP